MAVEKYDEESRRGRKRSENDGGAGQRGRTKNSANCNTDDANGALLPGTLTRERLRPMEAF